MLQQFCDSFFFPLQTPSSPTLTTLPWVILYYSSLGEEGDGCLRSACHHPRQDSFYILGVLPALLGLPTTL